LWWAVDADAQLDILANFFIGYFEDGIYVDDIYEASLPTRRGRASLGGSP
jgi:hypothetical protein